MARFIQIVRNTFAKKPLLSNCIVYGSLYAGAEFTQQTILRKVIPPKKEDYDLALVGRYGVLGSTVFPTFLFYWYKILDARLVGTAAKTIVTKVIVDQIVTAPPILATFYVGMSIMEGKSDIFAECKEKFVPSFKSSCMFWIPAQAVNFLLVPPTMRVVYIGTCSFLWVNILCILKREPTEDEKQNKQN